jgi:hypothetical protein
MECYLLRSALCNPFDSRVGFGMASAFCTECVSRKYTHVMQSWEALNLEAQFRKLLAFSIDNWEHKMDSAKFFKRVNSH